MHFDHRHYMPCVRWKQGEYEAIFRLSLAAKNFTTPLIEIAELGFDFETKSAPKTIDQHLAKFGKRLQTKWRHRSCFVDLKFIERQERMADGRHPFSFLFSQISDHGCSAVPVTGLARDAAYQQAVREVVAGQAKQLCIRLTIEEASDRSLQARIDTLLRSHQASAQNCHIVLDLGAPNFVPIEGFERLVEGVIEKLPYLPDWQTFTLLGTAFPASMGQITGKLQKVQRSEWILYKLLAANLAGRGLRIPTFGDYGINHPDVLTLDMRFVKPCATIRYATDDAWIVVKGMNTRDHGLQQYKQLCQTLINTQGYSGPAFSSGDQYIANCASGEEGTGNLTTWRRNGTNHHIEKVFRDIAKFFDSLGIQ